jgi:teichuronic acid exporter
MTTTSDDRLARDSSTAATDQRALDKALIRAVGWTAGLGTAAQSLKWLSTVFVARLLTPEDYGIVAAASVYLGFAALLTNFGVGSAILYQRDLTDSQIRQLAGIAFMLALGAFAASVLFATPMAATLGVPELASVLPAMGATGAFSVMNAVPVALIKRDLDFRTLSIIETVRALLSVATVLALALSGARYWSLVGGELAGVSLMTVWLYLTTRYRIARPRWQSVRSSLRLSSEVMANRFAWYLYSNADVAIVSRQLGPSALGDYSMAWTLTSMPSTRIATFLLGVTPSLFARVQKDTKALSRYYLRLLELLAIGLFPAIVGIALVARDAVPLLLGERWRGSVPIIEILALSVALRSVMPLSNQVLVSRLRADLALRYSALVALVLPVGFLFGARWGTTGVAAAWLTLYPLLTLRQFQITSRELELPLMQTVGILLRPFGGLLVMSAAVLGTRFLLADSPLISAVARLALLVSVGAVSYASFAWAFMRPQLSALVRLVRQKQLDD